MEGNDQNLPPTPYLPRFPSSSFLKDISNLKTPRGPSKSRNPLPPPPDPSPSPRFFTAAKQTPLATPSSSRCRRLLKSATARRKLKAFEIEQRTLSCRKEQIRKEQSLRCLSKSLTTWLNFLLRNPASCGCGAGVGGASDSAGLGKREGDGPAGWRCPKRQRGNDEFDVAVSGATRKSGYVALGDSLREVCSLEDLKERMRAYLSQDACKDVLDAMTRVVKNIDDGRLKMKPHCPIVTDVGMKEKATRVLMSYNPIWLRIGLHIIFGGDSLLPDGNETSELEMTFLKIVLEKQFFSHVGLAKAYAYNRMVEGLYRPGYYENLGNVILKRFLLLVLILDRAKLHSALPLKYGIDGVDGGSPLLFSVPSSISSSRQVINDFLSSEVMHGEGNLLAHLEIVGFRVSYEQLFLVVYDFNVNDLFVDLQDGVRLSRAIQLLLNDSSILTKLVVPSDTPKKHLQNCNIVLKYLQSAGVPLHDEDGIAVTERDIVLGDKELTISLLWNMFVHLQLPLLINKPILAVEVSKIRGSIQDHATTEFSNSSSLDLLFSWIQMICDIYDYKIDGFPSMVDGKAIWCLLDYYFRKEFHCPQTLEDPHQNRNKESIMSSAEYTDAVHNFILSQKLTTLLGNFPEVLQISDILEHRGAPSYQSVVILLVFLASQLIIKKAQDRLNFHKLLGCDCRSPERRFSRIERSSVGWDASQEELDARDTEDAAKRFKAIKAWWQNMAEKNGAFVQDNSSAMAQRSLTSRSSVDIQRENAAKLIQLHIRRSIFRGQFLKIRRAVCFLQIVVRAWLVAKQKYGSHKCRALVAEDFLEEERNQSENVHRYARFLVERHSFVKLKKSVLLIQRVARIWINGRRQSVMSKNQFLAPNLNNAALVIQKYFRCWAMKTSYKDFQSGNASSICPASGSSRTVAELIERLEELISGNLLCNQHQAATKIQTHFRGSRIRKEFLNQKQAIMKIQTGVRHMTYRRSLNSAAIIIQSHVRAWIARRLAIRQRYLINALQRCCRVRMIRKNFLFQREAVIKIQSVVRCTRCSKAFYRQRCAAIEIQRVVRGQIARTKLLGASHFCLSRAFYSNVYSSRGCCQTSELKLVFFSILKLQRWWRGIRLLKQRTRSATLIQSHFRGWICRQRASRERRSAVVIQSYWKGYFARKDSKEQLLDLRLRICNSAKNVDDSMRIINRLIVALSELESMKSIRGILHTCVTLDTTTQHSQKCCERLVAAGAIDSLLKLIRSVSRSIPDQEVLKHSLSTLRNLARYSHLVEVLIVSRGSVETLLWELLRNKDEGYFIAAEILKKICATPKGAGAMRRSPALLKRLASLVEEQKRRAIIEKRNPRGLAARENAERRVKEAVEILTLTANN